MNQREKNLLLGLLGVLCLWFVVWPLFESIVVAPIKERQHEISRLDEQINAKSIDEAVANRQQIKLARWKKTSLPPNELDAQNLYHKWLADLVEMAGFEQPKLTLPQTTPKGKFYHAVPIHIQAEATLDQVCRFLYLFHRADLLHRISSIKPFDSLEGNQGNPLLKVHLQAEGLSLTAAPDRKYLFRETELSQPLADDATSLVVASETGFPQRLPFRIRIGREYLTVTKIDGRTWTVERGVDLTVAREHARGAIVENAPVNDEVADRTPEFYAPLLQNGPFTIPGPPIEYRPRLSVPEQRLVRGNELKFEIKLTGHNPHRGDPAYRLADDAPAGMKIDPASGQLLWSPAADVPAGTYETTVYATQGESDNRVAESRVRVSFKEPNTPPTFASIERQSVYLGRPLSVQVKANDQETPDGQLRYSLGEGAPAGASIDASTGTFTWTPDLSVNPGTVEVTINAADNGDPQLTSSTKLPIDVRFDSAQFTNLVGIVGVDEDREAWLRDLSSNERTIVRAGESFTIADLSAYVLEIGPDFVMLLTGDQTWRLPLGGNLREMEQQATAATGDTAPAGSEPVEAPQPTQPTATTSDG